MNIHACSCYQQNVKCEAFSAAKFCFKNYFTIVLHRYIISYALTWKHARLLSRSSRRHYVFSCRHWLSTHHETTAQPSPHHPGLTTEHKYAQSATYTPYKETDKTFSYLQTNFPVSGRLSTCFIRTLSLFTTTFQHWTLWWTDAAFTTSFWGRSFSLDALVSVRTLIGWKSANTSHVIRKSVRQ